MSNVRKYLMAGVLPPIAGGAPETITSLDRVLKEYYPAGGIVNQLNIDTFLLDKVEKAKRFTNVGGRYFYKPIRFGLSGAVGRRVPGQPCLASRPMLRSR